MPTAGRRRATMTDNAAKRQGRNGMDETKAFAAGSASSERAAADQPRVVPARLGIVEAIWITGARAGEMRGTDAIEAIAGIGLAGDRYGDARSHTFARRRCQVTLIETEHLAKTAARFAAGALTPGIHRRNLVTRGVRLLDLAGQAFRVGQAVLVWDRRRPPCRRLDELAQGPLGRALGGWGGICTRVLEGGLIRAGDAIEVIGAAPAADS
jgi:MOSC domain-containing protein YiiM